MEAAAAQLLPERRHRAKDEERERDAKAENAARYNKEPKAMSRSPGRTL
jgi:hypothetical protein